MLLCSAVVLPGKDEFKQFQHYMYFSSNRAAAGLLSDFLTALVAMCVLEQCVAIAQLVEWR